MASLDFFRNVHNADPDFFDEGPEPSPKPIVITGVFINTSSIDTSEIDAYRQGVELTQQKHFDAGLAKISAGEPGHILRRNRYGMDKNFRNEPVFEELDYFKPVDFLLAQDALSPLQFNIITFPIITSDNDQLENYVFDGVIEPFTIRAKASFFSIDVPFEAHEVKGALMAGNTDSTWASDQVLTVYRTDLRPHVAFLDQYADTVPFPGEDVLSGTLATTSGSLTGSQHPAVAYGFFHYDKPLLGPFEDIRYVRNVVTASAYGLDMIRALDLMSGATDNYVPIGHRSATSGWDYDTNSGVGTDSLTFGGMVY